MPGGDRTGPRGMGPMTGRAAGHCAGFGAPGYASDGPGRGFGYGFGGGRGGRGRGFGGGRGWRHMFHETGLPGWMRYGVHPQYGNVPPYRDPDREMEKESLKSQAEFLQTELELVKKRLSDLEAATEAS